MSKRTRSRLFPALFAGLLGCAACSQAPNSAAPAAAIAALDALARECRDAGGSPHTADALWSADLDADGRDEHVLFVGWIQCENAASLYGDREKYLAVFNDSDIAPVFEDAVFDIKIERADDRAELWLTVMAEACGYPRASTFVEEHFCERAIVRDTATRRFGYAPLETIRPIE